MNVLVIGAGAIGTFLAARLQRAGVEVVLAARPGMAAVIEEQGICLEEPGLAPQRSRAAVAPGVPAALSGKRFDVAVLAVKAYHTEEVAQELARAPARPAALIAMQNGVGSEETLAEHLPGSAIIAGALTTPVAVVAPGHVRVARASFNCAFAPCAPYQDISPLAALFVRAGFRTQTFGDFRSLKWSKLLMNILANAQSAILGYTPAQIFASPELANLEIRAWREARKVMRGLGLATVDLAGYPLRLVSPLIEHLPPAVLQPLLGRVIAGGRGSKMPSLYYDLHPVSRGRSEIGWLNGAVHRHGQALGIATPVNSTFYSIMARLLAGEEEAGAWQGHPERLLAAVAEAEQD
ncbi:MAG: ketopantoate reductase family protein [Caldilineae bacterium]|nr:MAG: ketopantoate reductase family protein [Caldilineae bacterium]